jgi:hypothetical protein
LEDWGGGRRENATWMARSVLGSVGSIAVGPARAEQKSGATDSVAVRADLMGPKAAEMLVMVFKVRHSRYTVVRGQLSKSLVDPGRVGICLGSRS